MPPIDTSKVTDLRRLRFTSMDDLAAEVEKVASACRAGTLRQTGNWTAGQVFGHLSTWIDYGYDGYPPDLRPPWFVKLILRLQKKKFFRGPMPQGVRIPGQEHGTKGTEVRTLEEGLERIRRSIARLKAAPPSGPNVIFGPLSHVEWQTIHLRHAELH